MTRVLSLLSRLQVTSYVATSVGVLLVTACLYRVNLDNAALWHDEVPTSILGKNRLQRGNVVGWDWRNL